MITKAQAVSVVGGLIIGTAGSILAQTIWTVPPIYSGVGIAVLGLASGTILLVRRRTPNVKALGIVSILTDSRQKLGIQDICEGANCSFEFFGICAFRTVLDASFRQLLDNSRLRDSIEFRFLLLDPTSPELAAKARDEGEDPESLRHEVEATLTRLSKYKQTYNIQIEVRLYDSVPIWRMVFVNDETLYVNQFLAGKKGTDSPQILIHKGSQESLYLSFRKTFEHAWSKAKVYA